MTLLRSVAECGNPDAELVTPPTDRTGPCESYNPYCKVEVCILGNWGEIRAAYCSLLMRITLACSQHGTGDEDEQDAQGSCCQDSDRGSDHGTLVEESANVWFADRCPVHEGVFTVAEESHDGINLVLVRDDEVGCHEKRKNNPAADVSRLVAQNNVESAPEATTKADQRKSEAENNAERHEVTQSLGLQETGECITFHSLEDVVLSRVEHLRVITAIILDQINTSRGHVFRQDNLSLGAGQEVGVEYLLGTGTNIIPGHGVPRGVGITIAGARTGARLFI